MMRSRLLLLVLASAAACGDNEGPPLQYSNPDGGKLRLIHSKQKPSSPEEVVLDLVVGDQPLTGYSVGFDLPADHRQVRLVGFAPGTALDPGSSPPAAMGTLPIAGPLADTLVTGLSQKASGPGAVDTDTTLAPASVLYTIRLKMVASAPDGVVFDGTDPEFHLPSGGMRDRTGTTVVDASEVAIGKLEVHR